jgi:hypothetical protein
MNEYLKRDLGELLRLQALIIKDPKNKNSVGESVNKFNNKARKKLDKISWAIYAKTKRKEGL